MPFPRTLKVSFVTVDGLVEYLEEGCLVFVYWTVLGLVESLVVFQER